MYTDSFIHCRPSSLAGGCSHSADHEDEKNTATQPAGLRVLSSTPLSRAGKATSSWYSHLPESKSQALSSSWVWRRELGTEAMFLREPGTEGMSLRLIKI